jgi:LSD1 subclass zinc finger protein
MSERRVVVSTECPTCGAPLDFSEGSNAVRCLHCQSNLLVTGRGQVLSYWIPPRIAVEKARAQAALALRRARQVPRSLDAELYFLPYYRFTAHDFMWVKPEPKPLMLGEKSGDDAASVLGWGRWSSSSLRGEAALDLLSFAGDLIDGVFQSRSAPVPSPETPAEAPASKQPFVRYYDEVEFAHQHVEKNFIAVAIDSGGMVSIGVRSSVLRLQLFERAAAAAEGVIVAPDMDAATAWQRGMMLQRDRVIYRQTAGARLSVIYFPYWALGQAGSGETMTVVDGISGGVVSTEVPADSLTALRSRGSASGLSVSFRPLVCPNCGWDLPVREADVIFYCTSCHRALLLVGTELRTVPHDLAAAKTSDREERRYLPFWTLETDKRRVIVPAFRYRQLKHIQMLATRLAKVPQEIDPAAEPSGDLFGGFYDPGDAAKLASFILAGVTLEEGKRVEGDAQLHDPRLLWVPFRVQGNYLFDPFFGMNLFANLVG